LARKSPTLPEDFDPHCNRKYKKVIPDYVDNLLSRKRNITQEDVAELERLIRGGGETNSQPTMTTKLPPANLDLSVSPSLFHIISSYFFLLACPEFSKSTFARSINFNRESESVFFS
jgi:hypothetical protein